MSGKVMVQRSAFVLLTAAAVVLMLLNKSNTGAVERFRTVLLDTASPVLEVLSRPAITFSRVMEEARFLVHLHDENARLREENARLKHWQAHCPSTAAAARGADGFAQRAGGPVFDVRLGSGDR